MEVDMPPAIDETKQTTTEHTSTQYKRTPGGTKHYKATNELKTKSGAQIQKT